MSRHRRGRFFSNRTNVRLSCSARRADSGSVWFDNRTSEFVELRSEEGKSHALACLARALARKSRPTDLGSRVEHAPRLGAHSACLVEAMTDMRVPAACDVSVARSVPTPDRGRAFAAPILVPWSGRWVDFFETRLHVPRSVRLVEDMTDVRTESDDLRKPCISDIRPISISTQRSFSLGG